MKKNILVLSLFSLVPAKSYATELFQGKTPIIFSMRAGTLGIGPEIMYHKKYSKWAVRADFDTYNIGFSDVYHSSSNFHMTYDNMSVAGRLKTTYDGNVKLMNGSVFGDYYPFKKSAFRLTSGLIFGTNGITADGNASASGVGTASVNIPVSKTIRGHTITQMVNKTFTKNLDYPNAGYIKGKGHYNPVSPYLGIGFNTELGDGFYFNGDLGAMFQGNSDLSLHPTGMMTQFNGYQKTVQTAHNKIHHYMGYASPVYPVLMMGVGYRF